MTQMTSTVCDRGNG